MLLEPAAEVADQVLGDLLSLRRRVDLLEQSLKMEP
jgi:hypothetical protein